MAVNPDGNRFCGNCGAAFGSGLQESAVSAIAPVPDIQWGALKHATILFSDVVSSTEHVATLDAEQAMEQLRPAVQSMCDAVERFGGTVVRTLGDGVMALFGVPRALEGHADLACEAALSMQAAFEGPEQRMRIRVGLHSGQVALDADAVDATKGGGVHGRAIHLASRVVAMAEPGGICMTADCLALVRSACDVRPLGKHSLKGIAEPVELHVLLGLKNDVQGHQFHESAMSLLRGRERELRTLQDALGCADKGEGTVFGVSGAPGTGKSRLCYEFAEWCRDRLVPVAEVRTQLYGHATPLQPVLMLLRTCFFDITPVDDASAARQRIDLRLGKLERCSTDDLTLLHEFLGVADAGGQPCALNPKARRARLLGLLGELVKQAGERTSVILFEDLHWLDEASDEFLSVLVHAVAGTRTLLLLNYRPAYQAPWAALPHFRTMRLGDLSTADTEALVGERLRQHPELQNFLPLIVDRSAGNPFFAEELAHSLIEKSDSLAKAEDRQADHLALVQTLPATVHAVIGERIDRLVGTQKTLLHVCAVIGKEIPLAVLREVAVYLVSQMESGLEGLCEAELLRLLREIAGGRRFAFRHPLIQEVAYSTQLKARRANLHAAVAVAMEAHYSAQPGEFAALVAYHYEAAGQPVNAAQHEARAAKWAGSTNSAQAIKHWRKVWTLLEGQERSQQVNSLRALAGGRIVYLGWREGLKPQEVQQICSEALGLARDMDNRLEQLLLFAQGRLLQSGGGAADDYVASVLKALSLTPPGKDVGRVAMLNVALSQAYAWAGLLEQGLAANDAALLGVASIDNFDREFIDFSIEQWALGIRARLLIRMNRLDEAQACLHEMLSAGERLDDPVIRQITHHLHVELAAITQNADLAREHVAIVVNLGQQYASPYSKVFAHWCSGLAEISIGNLEAARNSFSEALEFIANSKVAVEFEAEIRASLAECHHKMGNLDMALEAAQENIGISKPRNNRLAECRALIVWGGVLGQKSDVDSREKALALFAQAEQLIKLTGAKIYEQFLLSERNRLIAH
ncbi:MAG: adenylate/guanylate cyclase domain-containing protein [Polaromonas sp.]|uniref:adenylate/guanylate cyclase domain-containing protein n=1 Tax=Polaromonas sp. TaxID=1869339 RepID=UPI0024876A39|nr:adenylate/guanylate cyclase domain-containing protein [Polaromonas sp.]MDI1239410.1 adenylate/guanylate cyclase domain-containing protein [Polaromonas sp.]